MEMGDERTERPEAHSGFGSLDLDRGRSLELAIPIVKRTVLLLRLLRERADAADRADADDARKSSAGLGGVAGCMQQGALEISAKAAPDDTSSSIDAEPDRSEATSAASSGHRSRASHSRTARTNKNRRSEGSSASPVGSVGRPRGRRNEEASR
jgi:hypothetical protein